MPVDEKIKRTWIELQQKSDVPVNALGVKIAANDTFTLKVWREEGIDKFLKK